MRRPRQLLNHGRSLALAALLCAGGAATAQAQAPPAEARQGSPAFRPPNTFRFGDVRIDFRVRLHHDFRRFEPDATSEGWEPTFRRARVGIQGQVTSDFDYDLDAELRDGVHPLRNAFVNYGRFESAEIRAGRFKVPFGREQMASIFEMDFIERSLINATLAPARDTGVMVHGEVADGILVYRTGVFAHDGDTSRVVTASADGELEDVRTGDGAWAGRLVVSPWGQTGGAFRRLELAAAVTVTSMDEGLFGVEGRTLSGHRFARRVYVRGRRLRTGLDGSWIRGAVSVQAEYIRLKDERQGQGSDGSSLPDAISRGWYVSGAWTLTGEPQTQELSPRRPLFRGGFGALELAARLESLHLGSGGRGGEYPAVNTRAANLL